MEKHIERLLETKQRDWDFCILAISNRGPMFIDKNTRTGIVDANGEQYLVLNAMSGHPAPVTEKDEKRQYAMESTIKLSAVTSVDFYIERRLTSVT